MYIGVRPLEIDSYKQDKTTYILKTFETEPGILK